MYICSFLNYPVFLNFRAIPPSVTGQTGFGNIHKSSLANAPYSRGPPCPVSSKPPQHATNTWKHPNQTDDVSWSSRIPVYNKIPTHDSHLNNDNVKSQIRPNYDKSNTSNIHVDAFYSNWPQEQISKPSHNFNASPTLPFKPDPKNKPTGPKSSTPSKHNIMQPTRPNFPQFQSKIALFSKKIDIFERITFSIFR